MSRTYARVYQLADGTCVGEIDVPRDDDDDPIPVQATGPDGAAALTRAADLADTLMQDPLLAAVIPPQAHLALVATRHLAEAASAGGGILRSLWKSIRGPGKKRLAKALMRTTPVRISDVGAGGVIVTHHAPGGRTTTRDHRKPRPRASPQTSPQYPGYPPQYPGYPPPGYGYPPSGGYPNPYGGYPQGYPQADPYAMYGYPPVDPYAAYGYGNYGYGGYDPYSQSQIDPYAAYGYDPTAALYDQNYLEQVFRQQ